MEIFPRELQDEETLPVNWLTIAYFQIATLFSVQRHKSVSENGDLINTYFKIK